jgi:hypothetical protein
VLQSQIYRKDDAVGLQHLCARHKLTDRYVSQPLYKRGNRDLIIINVMNLVLYALTFVFYRTINQRRDKIWNSWSMKVSGSRKRGNPQER